MRLVYMVHGSERENKYCTVILIILNTFKTRKLLSALDISWRKPVVGSQHDYTLFIE